MSRNWPFFRCLSCCHAISLTSLNIIIFQLCLLKREKSELGPSGYRSFIKNAHPYRGRAAIRTLIFFYSIMSVIAARRMTGRTLVWWLWRMSVWERPLGRQHWAQINIRKSRRVSEWVCFVRKSISQRTQNWWHRCC